MGNCSGGGRRKRLSGAELGGDCRRIADGRVSEATVARLHIATLPSMTSRATSVWRLWSSSGESSGELSVPNCLSSITSSSHPHHILINSIFRLFCCLFCCLFYRHHSQGTSREDPRPVHVLSNSHVTSLVHRGKK